MTFLANGDNQNMHTHHLDIHNALSPEKKKRKKEKSTKVLNFVALAKLGLSTLLTCPKKFGND